MNYHNEAPMVEGGNGMVRAVALVNVVDLNGYQRIRRVTVGREFCVSRDTAKSMANRVRENNPDISMRVQYVEEM